MLLLFSLSTLLMVLYTTCLFLLLHKRFLKKNMLLVGLWYSREKPTMTTYLKPFVDSINELLEKGEMECPRLVCTQVIGVSMRKYFTECAWSIAQ